MIAIINPKLLVSFNVELPEDEVQAAIHAALQNGDVQSRGFRAHSKMPLSFILKKYGEEFLSGILQTLITKKINLEVAAKNYDVAGGMSVQGNWSIHDRPLRYKYIVSFESYPKFDVSGIDSIVINKKNPTVIDDGHVDSCIDMMRRNNSSWKEINGPSSLGSRVCISFDGFTSDGDSFPGSRADRVDVDLGSGGMLPEFERALTGVYAGEEHSFEVTFPADYGTSFLAGKVAIFNVCVLSVSTFSLVPIDDKFPQLCGINGTVEDLREAVLLHLEKQHAEQDVRDENSDLLRQLSSANCVPLPTSLVHEQMKDIQSEMARYRGVSIHQIPIDQSILDAAQSRVNFSVVARRLAAQERIQINPEGDFTEQIVDWLRSKALKNAETTMATAKHHSQAAPNAAIITDVLLREHIHVHLNGDIYVTTATIAGTTPTTRVDNSGLALADIASIDFFDDIGDGKGPQKIGSVPNPGPTFSFVTGVLSAGNTHVFTSVVNDTKGHASAPSNAVSVFVPATLANPSAVTDLTVTLNSDVVPVEPAPTTPAATPAAA